ncbi:Oleate hydratase [Streptococcus parauberis]|nr:Oleate hydratase [Streptococcus parauberis]PNY21112.1 Oleate hydratase [Streptococcus parauberis]POS67193.1 Oleate hydratase [Streptococcus parauberis]
MAENDLVLVTNGSITESTSYGSHDQIAKSNKNLGGSWDFWENLAAQSDDFGHPKVFYKDLPAESWFVSARATISNLLVEPYIEHLIKRSMNNGKVNIVRIITVVDSNWLMSFAIHR